MYKKIHLFSAMIPTMLYLFCHRAPYCNKKEYVAKVPAEVIATFNSTTQAVHEQMRPRLKFLWKALAAKNHDSLKMMAAASIKTLFQSLLTATMS
jgi:hypothetical protein